MLSDLLVTLTFGYHIRSAVGWGRTHLRWKIHQNQSSRFCVVMLNTDFIYRGNTFFTEKVIKNIHFWWLNQLIVLFTQYRASQNKIWAANTCPVFSWFVYNDWFWLLFPCVFLLQHITNDFMVLAVLLVGYGFEDPVDSKGATSACYSTGCFHVRVTVYPADRCCGCSCVVWCVACLSEKEIALQYLAIEVLSLDLDLLS